MMMFFWKRLRQTVDKCFKMAGNRKSIRLTGYDYTIEGAYFITICTHGGWCLFGDIHNDRIVLNNLGKIVSNEWKKTGIIRSNIIADSFVVMPNHFHGIFSITCQGTPRRAPTAERFGKPVVGSVATVVRSFKSAVTKHINKLHSVPGGKVWQRNYYEYVIRDNATLNQIREYIVNNPGNWHKDDYNPNRLTKTT
jgi:REP element-mobilizing transposase RayT